jgi:plastocyanin
MIPLRGASPHSRRLAHVAVWGLLVGSAMSAAGEDLSGRVLLTLGSKQITGEEMEKVAVYFRPQQPLAVKPSEKAAEMATIRKGFAPESLVITQGTVVRFPNFDPILHNVFSVSGANRFDVGVYGRGDGASHRFDAPGVVRVFCNVHRTMYAHILVLDTPYWVTPDHEGRFHLTGLPRGRGALGVWHPQTDPVEEEVEAPRYLVLVDLDLGARKIPPHLNKFGRPYGGRRDY